MLVSKCSIVKIVQVKGAVWDLFLQQTLLATLLKLLQLLALLCNRTNSYVLKCVPVSCVHVEMWFFVCISYCLHQNEVCDLDPLLW